MADILDPTQLMYETWEPKTKNRFIMYIEGIPSYLIRATSRPKIAFAEITLDHINVKRKLKGKPTYDNISLTLYDPIVPSGAQSIMEWIRLSHEAVTGRDGYADMYKKDIQIDIVGPPGDIVEQWIFKGAHIAGADFGEGDWSDESGIFEITVDIAYNYFILNF